MQAVILAAGKSSRFYPLNKSGHKSSIKLLGKTILEHTILSVKKAGIEDIIVVLGKGDQLLSSISNSEQMGVKITYVTQEDALGMGDALLHAKKHITGSFFLISASHVDFHEVAGDMLKKQGTDETGVLLTRKEENLTEYGVLKFYQDRVLGIIEKPAAGSEPSNLRVVGMYLLPRQFLDTLEDAKSEHYSLESAIVQYAKDHPVAFVETEKNIITLKYAWHLLQIKTYLLSSLSPSISGSAKVADNAVIQGDVFVGEGARIFEGACIKGPCYIGPHAVIGNNALVRDGTIVEEKSVIGANMEVRGSIILSNSSTHSGFIGDSVIGERVKIGADILTANARIDRSHVHATVSEKKVSSRSKALGVIVGHDVRIGVRVTTMPGIIIGNNATVGPSTTVMKNVKENNRYYSTFSDIVEEENNNS